MSGLAFSLHVVYIFHHKNRRVVCFETIFIHRWRSIKNILYDMVDVQCMKQHEYLNIIYMVYGFSF